MSDSRAPIVGLRPKKRRDVISGDIKPLCNNPVERLCEKLLDWNFYDHCSLAATTKTKDMPVLPFRHVPTVFQSYNEYVDIWEPLVFDEIRANVLNNFAAKLKRVKSKEFQFSFSENKLKESNLMTIETQFKTSLKGGGDEWNEGPLTMDLVLFSPVPFEGSIFIPDINKDKTSESSASQQDIKKPPPSLLLGIVVGSNQSTNCARTYQIRVIANAWENFKTSIKPATTTRPTSTINSGSNGSINTRMGNANTANNTTKAQNKNGFLTYTMHYTIVESIRSNWREFLALHELRCNIPLLNEVLGSAREMDMIATPPLESEDAFHSSATAVHVAAEVAAHSQGIRIPIDQEIETWRMEGVTDKFMKYLRSKYNSSQLYAIRTSTSQMGFTLIQGPPGTGKTSTIIGILNAIHIREYNRHYEEALYTVLGPVGLHCRNSNSEVNWLQLVSRLAKKKPHILVVAPSNVAVDNIIERIMQDGFVDGNGGRYFPNMLRVGGGKTPRVQSVSLEDTMKQEEQEISRSADRVSHLVDLNVLISSIIADIIKCQTLLFDLKIAFDAVYPLPEGWELRMSSKTGTPYWVDHNLKRTSSTPPVIVKPQPGMPPVIRTRYTRIDLLPEFIVHSHKMTQLIDQLDVCNMKRTRLQTIMQTLTSSTGRGSSDVYNGNGGSTTTLQGKELLESSIIDSAQLLFTTLNSSGHPSMEATEFCVTVIDEAANCVEPSVLIALRRGCKQCIMVGDQQQLPATTFSTSAKAAGYERSLFERLVDSGQPYIMLDTQYRMAPQISAFPSTAFYFSNLRDGGNVTAEGYLPAHFDITRNSTAVMRPFMLFDLASSQETGDTTSKANLEEARLIKQLLWTLIAESERCGTKLGSVGVITPYSNQLETIRSMLVKDRLMRPVNNNNNNGNHGRGGNNSRDNAVASAAAQAPAPLYDIECNTVDGFQGREKDIIIISAVRANDAGQIGFLSDTRRLNVALTRAKYGLFVVGHAPTLKNNYFWNEMIEHARRSNCLVEVPNAEVNLGQVLNSRFAVRAPQHFGNLTHQYQTSSMTTHHRERPHNNNGNSSSSSSVGGGNGGGEFGRGRVVQSYSSGSLHERSSVRSDGSDEHKQKKSRTDA